MLGLAGLLDVESDELPDVEGLLSPDDEVEEDEVELEDDEPDDAEPDRLSVL